MGLRKAGTWLPNSTRRTQRLGFRFRPARSYTVAASPARRRTIIEPPSALRQKTGFTPDGQN